MSEKEKVEGYVEHIIFRNDGISVVSFTKSFMFSILLFFGTET